MMKKDESVPQAAWHTRFSERVSDVGPEKVGAGASEAGWLPFDDVRGQREALADGGAPREVHGSSASSSHSSSSGRARGRYGIWLIVIYALLCLAGVYADSRLLSQFDVAYLDYVGIEDFLTGVGSFGRLVATPSFILTFVGVATVAAMVVAGLSYAAGRRNGRPVRRVFVWRPYWALVLASVAAFAAINVSLLAEERNLLAFAANPHPAADTEPTYDVVSVKAQQQVWERLVNLHSNSHYEFYYDLATEQSVVLAKSEISDIAARSAHGPQVIAAATASTDAGTGVLDDRVYVETGGFADTVDPVGVGTVAQVAAVADSPAVPGEGEGEGEDASGALADSDEPVPLATLPEAAAVGDTGSSDAGSYEIAQAGARGSGEPMRPDGAAGGQLTAIEDNVERSRDSIDGLKSHLMRVETTVIKMREFIDDLDGAISGIDSAFTGLEAALAKTEALSAHADCPEVVLDPPLSFESGRAGLTLESIGMLFQKREQLVVHRSADLEEWLVVEGQWSGTSATAADQSLAAQRAEVVRAFLNSELGLPEDTLVVVASELEAPIDSQVRLFDCFKRRPISGTAERAPSPESRAIGSASAAEPSIGDPVRPAVFTDPIPAAVDAAPVVDDQAMAAADRASPAVEEQVAAVEEQVDAVEGRVAAVEEQVAAVEEQVEDQPTEVGDPDAVLGALPAKLDLKDTERGRLVTVSGLFGSNSTDLEPSARELLDKVGEILEDKRDNDVAVIGHTDSTGDADTNLNLSERRANAVRAYLLKEFALEPARLRASGWGENVPIASNATVEGRAVNRRIEVMIFN